MLHVFKKFFILNFFYIKFFHLSNESIIIIYLDQILSNQTLLIFVEEDLNPYLCRYDR